jgi:hypothetical protein
MRRLFLFVCTIALFSAALMFVPVSSAQKHSSAKTSVAAQQILPDGFGEWASGSRTAVVMWPRGPQAADFDVRPDFTKELVESGAVRVEEHYYERAGSTEVAIRAFRLRDPSSAYEIYTSLQRPGMLPTNLGQAAAFDKDGVILQEGVLVISSTANISKDDLNALLKAIEDKSEKSPLPPVRTYLPAQGRVLGTERYALGPDALKAALDGLGQNDTAGLVEAAGFSSGAEAMVAKYSSRGKDSGVLVLLEYPTPQLAEQHIHHLDEVLPAPGKQGASAIERKGSLLAIVLSPSSPQFAKQLREDADYETHVTWNEASQTATDPPWSSVLAKIFIGTGVFMVAAVVLGIAFGGVRVITKRLFPGKVFDRPGQIEILQLGLSTKPIDPKDLY